MSHWNSVPEMLQDLGLQISTENLDAVRKELRTQLAELHPDKHGGNFPSPAAKERFATLLTAMDFLDQQQCTTLIPVRDIPTIVAAMKQALQPLPQETAVAARAEYRHLANAEVHTRFGLPRIGSGAFVAICGAVLSFAGQLKDNPVFGSIVASSFGRSMLLTVFFYSGLLFVMTWVMEQRAAARAEWLTTEAGLRETLNRTLKAVLQQGSDAVRFRFSDFCHAISGRHPLQRSTLDILSPLFFLHTGLSAASTETLARVHLDELERRGIVKKVDKGRLDAVYELDSQIIQEVANWRDLWP